MVGHASFPQGMAAKSLYNTLAIAVKIDQKYGVIVSASCNLVTTTAEEFIGSILVGHCLLEGIEPLVLEVKERYHGAAQNAIIAALKDLHRTYINGPGKANQ